MKLFDYFKGTRSAYKPETQLSKKFEINLSPESIIVPKVDELIRAIQAARSKTMQYRVTLYDHYLWTLQIDDIVKSLIDKRLENLGNKSIVLMNGEQEIEDVNYFMKAPKFRDFLRHIVLTRFWGFNVFEFHKYEYNDKLWFDFSVIPHKHVNPYAKEVLLNQSDSTGANFEKESNIMFLGNPDDLGILANVTLISLYHRLGMFHYGRYAELASENFTQITTRGTGDQDELQKMLTGVQNRGAGGILQLPEGMEMRTESQSTSQQNQLFEGYINELKERLTVLILGQTMTTQDGSSRAQAEVHEGEQEKKYSSDEIMVLDTLNYEFIDYLPLWGFDNIPAGSEFRFKPNNQAEIEEKLRNYERLKNLGLEWTPDELKETFKDII
jgi:hypothetical protein